MTFSFACTALIILFYSAFMFIMGALAERSTWETLMRTGDLIFKMKEKKSILLTDVEYHRN